MSKFLATTLLSTALLCPASIAHAQKATTTKAKAATAASKAADAKAGEEIFTKNCSVCHSVVEGQQKVGPSLFHELKAPHPKHTTTEIRGFLKNGKTGTIGKMPSFDAILTKEDVDKVLAYLATL